MLAKTLRSRRANPMNAANYTMGQILEGLFLNANAELKSVKTLIATEKIKIAGVAQLQVEETPIAIGC